MHDDTLKKIALTGTIIGLLGLFAISMLFPDIPDRNLSNALFPEEELAISKVKLEDDGGRVSLTGRVVDVRSLDDATILTVESKERIDVFVHAPMNISVGDTVRIRGEVGEYQGEKEIIADQILAP